MKGIYWDDELPHTLCLSEFPAEDKAQILWLFEIRVRIWKGEALPEEDQQFWDAAESLGMGWAFFRRQAISAQDLWRQEEVERQTAEGLAMLVADADEIRISEEDGVQGFSFVFDLTKAATLPKKKDYWWKRMFRRSRPDQ